MGGKLLNGITIACVVGLRSDRIGIRGSAVCTFAELPVLARHRGCTLPQDVVQTGFVEWAPATDTARASHAGHSMKAQSIAGRLGASPGAAEIAIKKGAAS